MWRLVCLSGVKSSIYVLRRLPVVSYRGKQRIPYVCITESGSEKMELT